MRGHEQVRLWHEELGPAGRECVRYDNRDIGPSSHWDGVGHELPAPLMPELAQLVLQHLGQTDQDVRRDDGAPAR